MSLPPPPPPPGTPPPPTPPPSWGAAGADFSVGNALSYGWRAYWRNAGPMILLALVIFAVNLVISLIGQSTTNTGALIVLQLLSFIVGIVLAMGLIRASLAVCRGETPTVNLLLVTDGFVPYLGASILVGLGVVLGLVLCIVPGLILAVMWHFFGYVIVEHPTTRATDSMRRSAEITKGHRWELFGLGLVLILINLVGLLACGVGVIFTYGITAITVAYAYRTLSGQTVAPA
jgi:uncharacterized membrane protein